MAKHDAGYYAANFLNPFGPIGLIYDGVAEGIASGREADARADTAQAAAQERQAKANEASAKARQKIAQAAAYERSVAPPSAAAPPPGETRIPAAAPSMSRPVVGAGTFTGANAPGAGDTDTNWYVIGGIAAVVAGVAYYTYSRRKK